MAYVVSSALCSSIIYPVPVVIKIAQDIFILLMPVAKTLHITLI